MNKIQLSNKSPETTFEELKMKYKSSNKANLPETSQAPTIPKKLKLSKVKQMASMFNLQISQIIKREGKYSPLSNEFPLEAQQATLLPSPRREMQNEQTSNCFVADEICDKLSVKDKAQLYSQYIRNMTNITPKAEKTFTVISPIPAPRTKFQKTTNDAPKLIPPIPAPRKKYQTQSRSSSFLLSQQSEIEESESGCSSLPKTTSDESQVETMAQDMKTFEKDIDFVKPLKALRKKKFRRSPAWKKDGNMSENFTAISTDSDSNGKRFENKIKNKNQEVTPDVDMVQTPVRLIHSPRQTKLSYSQSIINLESSKNDSSQVKHTPVNTTLTDQGFETETHELDCLKSSSSKSLAFNLQEENSPAKHHISPIKNNFGCSTPIKEEFDQSFSCTNSAKQQLFSPIDKPIRNRRRSLYDSESRRSSLAMQVIREDQPLEHHVNENKLLAKDSAAVNKERTSEFWIKCGDYSVVLDIFYTNAERVQLLYEIFTQTSCDTKDLHFGIDNNKFSVHNSPALGDISARLPNAMGTSHYWFSTGDLAIPFSGKYLSTQKIQRLFQFIKASVEETGILEFGVDNIEFSRVPEFWHEQPKFSMESNYSMLVGLQSGFSTGLEGRSKYAWPHAGPVKVTDLDETSYNGEADFEVIESGRLSYSPFGSNHYDLSALDNDDLEMPRNSDAMLSLETYCYGYENESLDKLFENNFNQKPNHESTNIEVITVPKMLKTMETQQQHLSLIQNDLSYYTKPLNPAEYSLHEIKNSPEYLTKLKSIVHDINNLVINNKLKDCSPKQLESYMFFLSRYADVCLNNCHDHINNVLDVLNDNRAAIV